MTPVSDKRASTNYLEHVSSVHASCEDQKEQAGAIYISNGRTQKQGLFRSVGITTKVIQLVANSMTGFWSTRAYPDLLGQNDWAEELNDTMYSEEDTWLDSAFQNLLGITEISGILAHRQLKGQIKDLVC